MNRTRRLSARLILIALTKSSRILVPLVPLLLVLATSCGKEKTTSPSPIPETTFKLPFASSFEGFDNQVLYKTWQWEPFVIAWVARWSLDSTDASDGKQSIALSGKEGLKCGGPANIGKKCLCTDLLYTYKPIDFTSVTSATLHFMNKRRTAVLVSPPSCWGTYACSGGNTIAFKVVWLDSSQPPGNTPAAAWNVLATFTDDTGWKPEQVDLAPLIGRVAYVGFWQPDYCVAEDSASTVWHIDDVVVQP